MLVVSQVVGLRPCSAITARRSASPWSARATTAELTPEHAEASSGLGLSFFW